jgi:hypothetical protein
MQNDLPAGSIWFLYIVSGGWATLLMHAMLPAIVASPLPPSELTGCSSPYPQAEAVLEAQAAAEAQRAMAAAEAQSVAEIVASTAPTAAPVDTSLIDQLRAEQVGQCSAEDPEWLLGISI